MTRLKPIPTTLLTGFLGSGKTTYLNQLLQSEIATDSLVLVNDFGHINIDASLIAYQDEDIIRLNNGCVCCTLGASMAEKLAEIGRLNPVPAALYIELSGVANAARVADMIQVARRFELLEVRCFVDVSLADHFSADERVNTVWQQQIVAASCVVLNRLTKNQILPKALIGLLTESKALIEYSYLSDSKPALPEPIPFNKALNTGEAWHSFSFESEEAFSLAELTALLQEFAAGLYRVKGLVRTADGKTMVLQWTKTQCRIIPSARVATQTQLVFIGMDAVGLEQLKGRLTQLQAVMMS